MNIKQEDNRPYLSIIKNDFSQQILNALSDLQDNNFLMQGQTKSNNQIYSTKIFNFTSIKLQSELINQIKLLINEKQHAILKQCSSIIQQFYDVSKLVKINSTQQINQILSSIILFSEISSSWLFNSMLGSICFLKLLDKDKQIRSQRVAFINLTGLSYAENAEFLKMFEGNCQKTHKDIYVEFQGLKASNANNKSQYQYLLNIQNKKIDWKDIKHLLKLDIKRKLELAKSQLFILQFCIEMNEDQLNQGEVLQYEFDCITRITRFFQKLSNEKLFINLVFKKNSRTTKVLENIEGQNIQNRKDHYYLKQFINAIEQGVLGNQIYDQTSNQVSRQNIHQLKNYALNKSNQLQSDYRRIHNSFLIKHNIQFKREIQETQQQTKIPIISSNGHVKYIELINNGHPINYNKQSQLIINYDEKILILFNYNQFQLFYCLNVFEDDTNSKEALLIDISQYKDELLMQEINRVIPPNVAILNQKIYFVYGYLGCRLLEYDLREKILIDKTKSYLPNEVKFIEDSSILRENIRQREGACVCYNSNLFKNSTFSLIGGELGIESQLCNLIETLQVQENNFQSGQILKEQLNKYKSMRPFKDMLILEEQNYILLLPGDYNNQNYKYSQIINPTFYQQAMKLSKVINGFKWEYIDLNYQDKTLQQRYPIHKFNSKQSNIKKIESNSWIACFQLFDEQDQFLTSTLQFQKFIQFKYILQDKNLQIDITILSENIDNESNQTIFQTAPQMD